MSMRYDIKEGEATSRIYTLVFKNKFENDSLIKLITFP
jgi:hypothetical protein